MSDYIDRQAAIKAIGERPIDWTGSDFEIAECWMYDACKSAIENLPAADVRPVVRGNWVFAEDSVFRCSICDRICYELGAPFCYCGADMRGEAK